MHNVQCIYMVILNVHMYYIYMYVCCMCPYSDQSAGADSATSFQWLQGYEMCRTGWDRFAKPQALTENHSGHLIDLGGAERGPLRTGFPETWPWSHIITPNSDGKTEIASK